MTTTAPTTDTLLEQVETARWHLLHNPHNSTAMAANWGKLMAEALTELTNRGVTPTCGMKPAPDADERSYEERFLNG